MHPDRQTVLMDRQSDGLSKIPDYPNTITLQSDGMNNAPWDPLFGLVTGSLK